MVLSILRILAKICSHIYSWDHDNLSMLFTDKDELKAPAITATSFVHTPVAKMYIRELRTDSEICSLTYKIYSVGQ